MYVLLKRDGLFIDKKITNKLREINKNKDKS